MKINNVVLNSFWMSNMDKHLRKFKYKTFARLAQTFTQMIYSKENGWNETLNENKSKNKFISTSISSVYQKTKEFESSDRLPQPPEKYSCFQNFQVDEN